MGKELLRGWWLKFCTCPVEMLVESTLMFPDSIWICRCEAWAGNKAEDGHTETICTEATVENARDRPPPKKKYKYIFKGRSKFLKEKCTLSLCSMVRGPAASVSPRNCLEMQSPATLQTPWVRICMLVRSPRYSHARLHWRSPGVHPGEGQRQELEEQLHLWGWQTEGTWKQDQENQKLKTSRERSKSRW